MKKLNFALSLISIAVLISIITFTVYAVLNVSFTLSNRIMFTSTGVYYKAEANVYLLNEEELLNYNGDIEAIIDTETSVTETYFSDNSSSHADSTEWVIPDGDLRFTSSNRFLVYVIKIENYSTYNITVSINLPQTHSVPYFDDIIQNTPSDPINLNAFAEPTVSSGYVYLITKCKKIHNSFNLENSFEIQLAQVED